MSGDGDDPLIQVVMDEPIVCLPDLLLLTQELSIEARLLACLHYVHRREPTAADIEEAFGIPAEDLGDVIDELAAWPRYEEYL